MALNTDIASTLYKALVARNRRAESPEPTVLVSPLSVVSALLLVSLGAEGRAEGEIWDALSLSPKYKVEIHKHFRRSQDALSGESGLLSPLPPTAHADEDDPGPSGTDERGPALKGRSPGSLGLEMAFGLVTRIGLRGSARYIQDSDKFYGSHERNLVTDFVHGTHWSRIRINRWVEQQTRNKIQDCVPEGLISASTSMMLVSACYFKGKWLEPFEESQAVDSVFQLTEDRCTTVKLMCGLREVRLHEDERYRYHAVELPYGNSDIAIIFIRPDDVEGLARIENTLSSNFLYEVFNFFVNVPQKSRDTRVNVGIPRFRIEGTFDMRPVLEDLGVMDLFRPWSGGLTQMLPDNPEAAVSGFISTSCIEVGNDYVEGGGSTRLDTYRLRHDPDLAEKPQDFHLDHPFMFVVFDKASQTILFIGRCTDPKY